MKKIPLVLAIASIVIACFVAIYLTFIQGAVRGPDFLERVKSGSINAESIGSIQIIIPDDGTTPFYLDEIEEMKTEYSISDKTKIDTFLRSLEGFGRQRIHQNRPSQDFRRFLRINTNSGFYLVYCSQHTDSKSTVFTFTANTLNATNPNSATAYYATSSESLLTNLISKDKRTEQIKEESISK